MRVAILIVALPVQARRAPRERTHSRPPSFASFSPQHASPPQGRAPCFSPLHSRTRPKSRGASPQLQSRDAAARARARADLRGDATYRGGANIPPLRVAPPQPLLLIFPTVAAQFTRGPSVSRLRGHLRTCAHPPLTTCSPPRSSAKCAPRASARASARAVF